MRLSARRLIVRACLLAGLTNLTIIALGVAGWVYWGTTIHQLQIAEKLSFPINPSDMSPMYSTGTPFVCVGASLCRAL